jgi:branched-chain amino acid transport system substrate-binding protein
VRGHLRRVATLALVAGLVAVSCSSAVDDEALVVGTLYPTSGAQAAGGADEERGVRLAVDWVNAHGGVLGRSVRLERADAPRAEAVPSAMRALRDRDVRIVIGSHGSAVSATAAEVASRDGMVLWETGAVGEAGAAAKGGSNFFRLSPMGANLGRSAIAFVRDQLAPKLPATAPLRYTVAYVDDPYGRAVAKGAITEIETSGLHQADTIPYDARAADFGALAQRVAGSRTDVLFAVSYLDDGVALRRALVAAHVPLMANIGTSSSYCHPAFGERLGGLAVGTFASDKPDESHVRAEALRPEGRRTLTWASERYEREYGETMSAEALAGFANGYSLFAHVLPKAGSLDPVAVARAALDVKLAAGTLANGSGLDLAPPGAFDAGENRAAASVIWEWVAPRERAVVWPSRFATHAIEPLLNG